MRRSTLSALLPLLLAAACESPSSPPGAESRVVVFVFDGHPADTLRVRVRHAPTLREAERVVAGRSRARIPAGPIVRGAGEDPRYPFHFLPAEVRLTEVAMELCDGAPMRTEAEVNAYFLGATGDPQAVRAPWCPWSARPIRVE